jgi:hypothetical protein
MRAASWPRPFESRSKNHGIVRNRLAQASRRATLVGQQGNRPARRRG